MKQLTGEIFPKESTMNMSKWDVRSILESMVNIQRHAGVTIAGILDEAVSYESGSIRGGARLGHCTWNCEESPVMLCVYDSYKDPAMDSCIFCGEPDQRK